MLGRLRPGALRDRPSTPLTAFPRVKTTASSSSSSAAPQPPDGGYGPPAPAASPAGKTTQMAHVSPDGEVHPYSQRDNATILGAMLAGLPSVRLAPAPQPDGRTARLEVRFGASAVSAQMKCPPSSGIIQVDLDTQSTCIVRRVGVAAAAASAAAAAAPEVGPGPGDGGSRFAFINPQGQRELFSCADSLLIEAALWEGAPSVRLSGGGGGGGKLDAIEVRFGESAVSESIPKPPRTGMLQVNLATGHSSIVVDVSGGSTPVATRTPIAVPGRLLRSRSATLSEPPSTTAASRPSTPLLPGGSTRVLLKLARQLVGVLEASVPVPMEEVRLLVARLNGAITAGGGDDPPPEPAVSKELDKRISRELSSALRTILAGATLKLCLPGSFGLGMRKNACFVAVSPETGDVVWMKKPLLWATYEGEPKTTDFEAEVSRLPKGAYKRERLVGVIPQAAQVSIGAECSFVLALERTQLVLVAEDPAVKETWVAACFAVLERKANAAASIADAAVVAAAKDAQAAKAAAAEKKMAAAAAAQASRQEAEEAKAQAQADARAFEAAVQAKAEAAARAAEEKAAQAKATAAAALAQAAHDVQAAKDEAEAKKRAAAAEAEAAKAQAAAEALVAAQASRQEAEAAKAQAQADARAFEAAAQAKAEAAARTAEQEAAKMVEAATASIAQKAKDLEAAKDAADAEKEAAAKAALAAAEDFQAKAEAAKAKAAADLQAELEKGRAQLDAQIVAYGGAGLKLEEERTCVICYDDYRGYNDGVECGGSEPHFVCNECFIASVGSSITDELGKQDLRGGRLACPMKTFPPTEGSCDAPPFDDRIVAKKVDAPTFEAYQQARNKLIEAKLAREGEVAMERKIKAAIKRMQEEGVKVFETQRFIVDDILTMRCPRCRMAFADWDGCNALYCTYAGCGCNFCAFCLKDCGGGVKFGQNEIRPGGGDEVHQHVRVCKYAQGIGFGNDGRVQGQVWNEIRKTRIEDCLRERCSTVEERRKVVENLRKQFDALGLKIEVPGGEGACPAPGSSAASSSSAPAGPGRPRRARARERLEVGLGLLEPDDSDDSGSSVGSADSAAVARPGAAAGRALPAPPDLPPNIKACPACGILIEKIDGNEEVMCGCEAKPAGGTYEKALRGGGCGHMFNFNTLAPMGVGRPGHPANERQVRFLR